MAISINWGTKTINIPKTDTSLIQITPFEVRQLDLNTFRLALKDLEDSVEGISFPTTHNHNTQVTLAGVTFARLIEIINGYTVTFEDGNYAVNLVGANSNIADKVNLNQVSVRSANSAGLIVTAGEGQNPVDIANAVWEHSTAIGMLIDLLFLKDIEGGRWKIINNQMIFYKADNVTEIARFNLKDSLGNATSHNPMERERI